MRDTVRVSCASRKLLFRFLHYFSVFSALKIFQSLNECFLVTNAVSATSVVPLTNVVSVTRVVSLFCFYRVPDALFCFPFLKTSASYTPI